MIDQATNRDLSADLTNHLAETEKQIERLDKVFKKRSRSPQCHSCPAMPA
jgi:ferritin-like metal-binding protein YciE